MVTGDDAAGAEVGVQVGQVGDAADVRRLIQRHDQRRVQPPAEPLGAAFGGPHRGVGQRGDQRRRRRPGLRQQVEGVAAGGELLGVEHRQAAAAGRGDPGHDLRVGHRLGGGAGGLVDPVPGLGRAVLRAAQRGGHGGEPGVHQQLDRGRDGGLVQPPGHVVQGHARNWRAARNSAASRSWAAGPHRSRRFSSATVRTKCPASRWASSTVRSPASRSHHQACGWWVMLLRVEQPHPPAGRLLAQRGGGGPQVGLVRGGDHRAGRGQHERDRLGGGLARPRCHEADHGVFPRRVHRRPRRRAGAHQLPERQPGLRRVDAPRGPRRPGTGAARSRPGHLGNGSAPASADCGPAPPPDPPARATAARPPAPQPRPARPPRPVEHHGGDQSTAAVGVCGHACCVRPCSRSPVNFIPNGSV